MTAKERREMDRLKIRCEELGKQLHRAHRVTGNLIRENVTLTCALRSVSELLAEAGAVLTTIEEE